LCAGSIFSGQPIGLNMDGLAQSAQLLLAEVDWRSEAPQPSAQRCKSSENDHFRRKNKDLLKNFATPSPSMRVQGRVFRSSLQAAHARPLQVQQPGESE
jgi:hypothetical protein